MIDLLSTLKNNPFVLAPMAGITDSPFRSFMRDMGCGIVISELISAHGIRHKGARTLDLMKFTDFQRPVGIQLFGEEGPLLADAAQFVESLGADFVDINLGCPVPKVVKKGAGSALLKDPIALGKILSEIKKSIKIPLTIKIRTGWSENSRNAKDVVQAAADAGVTWVAIHGRTRDQGYSGASDWDYIKKIKETAEIPIIGNGDIGSPQMAIERLRSSGCDGVMIGRGCLKNPWIFKQALEILKSQQNKEEKKDLNLILEKLKFYIDERKDERYSTLQMKKFIMWFSSGYPKSQNFRKILFTLKDSEEILSHARDYFITLDTSQQIDTSGENFLMGGHG